MDSNAVIAAVVLLGVFVPAAVALLLSVYLVRYRMLEERGRL